MAPKYWKEKMWQTRCSEAEHDLADLEARHLGLTVSQLMRWLVREQGKRMSHTNPAFAKGYSKLKKDLGLDG